MGVPPTGAPPGASVSHDDWRLGDDEVSIMRILLASRCGSSPPESAAEASRRSEAPSSSWWRRPRRGEAASAAAAASKPAATTPAPCSSSSKDDCATTPSRPPRRPPAHRSLPPARCRRAGHRRDDGGECRLGSAGPATHAAGHHLRSADLSRRLPPTRNHEDGTFSGRHSLITTRTAASSNKFRTFGHAHTDGRDTSKTPWLVHLPLVVCTVVLSGGWP